jgi:REP element-mobilizing transposase RayT
MPRQARLDAPGTLHHVMARGIEGTNIFRTDKDRDDFLDRLAAQCEADALKVYAWALIPNHLHLLARTGNRPLFVSMRKILTGYVVRFNRRHKRQGHLFQNRYKSIVCEEDPYLLELTRYIHLIPLRAGMVRTLKELERYPCHLGSGLQFRNFYHRPLARKPRVYYPGALYHVTLRGNVGQAIFFDNRDRTRFYFLLQEGIERFRHRICAYCPVSH